MSRTNVERAYEAYAAVNRGDLASLVPLVHPDAQMFPIVAGLSGSVYVGQQGIAAWMNDLEQGFEVFRVEPRTIESLGTWTLTVGVAHVVGRESGLTLQRPFAQLMRWTTGTFVWVRSYTTRDEALEALEALG